VITPLLRRIAAAALVAAAAAPTAAPSPPVRPAVSLSATPAHLTLLGRIPETLILHNDGAARIRVVARVASFSLDLAGNATIGPPRPAARSAATWLSVRPRRFVLAPDHEALVRVVARPPRVASAGDHHALVLLSTFAPGHAPVSVRTRLGVLALVRVPGRVVRRLTIGRVRFIRGGTGRVAVSVFNRGNVAERLARGQVTIALLRAGRTVAILRSLPRDLLPYTQGVVTAPLGRSLRGPFTAVVRVAGQPDWTAGPAAPKLRGSSRTMRLRL